MIGFPKQLSQLKLIETELSGFVCATDERKKESVDIEESWRKLIVDSQSDHAALSHALPIRSGFDSIIFLETPEEHCLKRAEEKGD